MSFIAVLSYLMFSGIKDGVRVWFDEKSDTKSATVIPYDSIPYVFLGKKVLMCSLGPDKHKTVKKRLKEKYIESVNVCYQIGICSQIK